MTANDTKMTRHHTTPFVAARQKPSSTILLSEAQVNNKGHLSARTSKEVGEDFSKQEPPQTCDRPSHLLDQMPLRSKGNIESAGRTADEGIGYESKLAPTIARLEGHMKDVISQFVTKARDGGDLQDNVAELIRLQDKWEATRQRLSIYSAAAYHLRDNVSTINSYATGDAVQIMVSTNGKTLHGSNRGSGQKTRQIGGYLGGDVMAQLLQDLSSGGPQNTWSSDSSE